MSKPSDDAPGDGEGVSHSRAESERSFAATKHAPIATARKEPKQPEKNPLKSNINLLEHS